MKEFKVEYFIISIVLLLRHLLKHYVFREEQREWFHGFVLEFYQRWKTKDANDTDIIAFSDSRQQSQGEIEIRQRLIRQNYFEWVANQGHEMRVRDQRRTFNEAERIRIYRRDRGLCQKCLEEGKTEIEAYVPWREYDADHVLPHAEGGHTSIENARVLCRYHNRAAGARLAQE